MAHYQLFIPGVQGANNKHLIDRGLGDLLDKHCGPEWMHVVDRGPGALTGMLCAWRTGIAEIDPSFGYHANKQTWQPIVAKPGVREEGAAWIGWETARPPEPYQLLRSQKAIHAGNEVQLGDGNFWVVPEAKMLESSLMLMPDGQVGEQVSDEFAAFAEQANGFAQMIMQKIMDLKTDEADAIDFSLGDCFAFCCESLALNYRVNQEIATALRLITHKAAASIVLNVVSAPDILEVKKKEDEEKLLSIPVG